jgi:hypothetical protein
VPSTLRIPKAGLSGPYGRLMTAYARRTWGQVPDGAYLYWHHKPLMRAVLGFERRVGRWNALDRSLKTCAEMASAAAIGCGDRLQLVPGLRLLPRARRGSR